MFVKRKYLRSATLYPMSPATQQDISKTNRIFEQAVIDRNLQLLDGVYTADARILPPGLETIAGRENIKQFWGAAIEVAHTEVYTNAGTSKLRTPSCRQ